MPLKADLLDDLKDDELQAVIDHSNELLAERDRQRKDKALERARAILTEVGLSLKDVAKAPAAKAKGPVYHSGTQYAHPTNKTLVWSGRGKRPTWLVELEAQGGKAVEAI